MGGREWITREKKRYIPDETYGEAWRGKKTFWVESVESGYKRKEVIHMRRQIKRCKDQNTRNVGYLKNC